MNLSSTIKSIQDIMRKDDGVDGDAQRLGQLTWMLFLKVFDQREEEWEANDATYQSPLPDQYRWRRWATRSSVLEGNSTSPSRPENIIAFINSELFPALKSLDSEISPQHKVINGVFKETNNYMKSGSLLLTVIERLEATINFHDFTTRAQLGDVYEQLLNDLRGAGNAGEFYTPRAITQFMVERINPSLKKKETVLDPACGTGGFLSAAIDHLSRQRKTKSGTKELKIIESSIFGYEKKQLPHLLCTTNMLLHGIDIPSRIERTNTLGIPWDKWHEDQRVNCIVSNPPFGGYEEDGVGRDYPVNLKTRETADMFMALIIEKLLAEKGRAAVVLPDGFLFGDGTKASLKELLLRKCNLHTIIRLPKGVFAPYTTIKTNLLFFTKGKEINNDSEHFHTDTIWYYEHPYPKGYKSYSKTKPIQLEEFAPEQAWWGSEDNDFADREENEFAWKIDFKGKREKALAAAEPYWQRAEQFKQYAEKARKQAKYLNDSLISRRNEEDLKQILQGQLQDLESDLEQKNADTAYTSVLVNALSTALKRTSNTAIIESVKSSAKELRQQADDFELQARDAQAAGDRIYWPIFNLDLKNPNAPEEESHDPDELLVKYKKLLGEIEETENQLKSELAAALPHHFSSEGAEA